MGFPVMDAADVLGCDQETRYQRELELIRRRFGIIVPPPPPASEPAPGNVLARVYRNAWIVDCPDCGSAEFVWRAAPWFLCSNCWNGKHANAWRAVSFPDNLAAIEDVLSRRPIPAQRNWTAETVDELERENAENGDPSKYVAPEAD